jgi:hypothetical protein
VPVNHPAVCCCPFALKQEKQNHMLLRNEDLHFMKHDETCFGHEWHASFFGCCLKSSVHIWLTLGSELTLEILGGFLSTNWLVICLPQHLMVDQWLFGVIYSLFWTQEVHIS